MRITAVTCVKNEGPFLVEWIAFNRVIGVTDFLFYSNDCTDGTDAILDGLAAEGLVTHLPNPAQGRNYQMEALKDAARHPVVNEADWVWIADVDEFLNIHVGDGTIPELVAACDDPAAISITFQFMANGGVTDFEDRPVIGQFNRTHDPDIWNGDLDQEVKTLIRRDFPVQYYGAHRPFMKKGIRKKDRPSWTDGSGRDVEWKFRTAANKRRIRKFPAKGARNFATLNHYALRSLDSYLVKNDRGDVNRENRSFEDTYWRERNDPAWEETSIHRYLPKLQAEREAILSLGGLRALHEASVTAHRDKARALRKDPALAVLADRLLSLSGPGPAERALLELLA
ncbi:glycosyltransferase family 2 protein [Maritimibacter sp. DP1N21-5]|uniref:glycosyltransferase family 2 protein n=1 Tax=Maritimibacter sp. DP1N21-5 TaxID=2836867 RepID=UPI001C43ECDA|nr:glycosyltransferase family 2 protein [Maritimibacter sp. DP1N21-5]MBV7410132.1 glycosyltransferase family 2 protein [Maritimibacter sp. DP1N21-5]